MNKTIVYRIAKDIIESFDPSGKAYNGVIDITEHQNFPEIAEENNLSEEQYHFLIELCQELVDGKTLIRQDKYFFSIERESEISFLFNDYDAFMEFQEDFEGWEDKQEFDLLVESLEGFIANSEFSYMDCDESMCYISLDEVDESDNLVKSYRLENAQYYNIFQYMMTGKYGDYWKDGYDSCLGREMVFVKTALN